LRHTGKFLGDILGGESGGGRGPGGCKATFPLEGPLPLLHFPTGRAGGFESFRCLQPPSFRYGRPDRSGGMFTRIYMDIKPGDSRDLGVVVGSSSRTGRDAEKDKPRVLYANENPQRMAHPVGQDPPEKGGVANSWMLSGFGPPIQLWGKFARCSWQSIGVGQRLGDGTHPPPHPRGRGRPGGGAGARPDEEPVRRRFLTRPTRTPARPEAGPGRADRNRSPSAGGTGGLGKAIGPGFGVAFYWRTGGGRESCYPQHRARGQSRGCGV